MPIPVEIIKKSVKLEAIEAPKPCKSVLTLGEDSYTGRKGVD
jgi:hypothetical protein